MKVAVFGKQYKSTFNDSIIYFFKSLNQLEYDVYVFETFYNFITEKTEFTPDNVNLFNEVDCEQGKFDLIFSIGGDGTFLECAALVKKCDKRNNNSKT